MESGNWVGTVIAGCRLLELVGRGSMGEVYRGIHDHLQRPVAVKVLPIASRTSDEVDRLLVEARALAKLEHPNIVRVYDVGIQNGLFHIVMQFLEGDTLKTRFEEMGPLPPDELYSTIADVARGLEAMHQQGIVHRDLKMENIILGRDGRARIMDFGLVRDADAKDTYQGLIVGTPPYIPPEIWLGRSADPRSDLYSLGVILYAASTGEYPFRGKNTKEYSDLHLKSTPKRPSEVSPPVGEGLSSVILKLLSRNRADRYPAVKDFVRDLEACREGRSPEAAKSTGRRVKCGFCEAVNPATAARCGVCGEALSRSSLGLDLTLRTDEIPCPSCGAFCERDARACPRCGEGICLKCRQGIAAIDGLCHLCAPRPRKK